MNPFNIASCERNPDLNKDSLFSSVLQKCDLIIIRIGENVLNTKTLDEYMADLLLYIKKRNDAKIIMIGNFWTNRIKDAKLRIAASKFDIPFISLSHCDKDENKAINGG